MNKFPPEKGAMPENTNLRSIVNEAIEITAKTILSAIPIGGTLISCIWDSIKSNCVQKRLDEWKQLVEERLAHLETTLEDIGQNENFTSAMFHATESAIKTAERQKREYLANAVLSSVSCSLDESIIMMFFGMIDRYTLWHLKILTFFKDPTSFKNISSNNYMMGSPKGPLYEVYPELRENDKLVDKIVKELYNDGMMSTENLNCTMSGRGMVDSRVTELGSQFVQFLSCT